MLVKRDRLEVSIAEEFANSLRRSSFQRKMRSMPFYSVSHHLSFSDEMAFIVEPHCSVELWLHEAVLNLPTACLVLASPAGRIIYKSVHPVNEEANVLPT